MSNLTEKFNKEEEYHEEENSQNEIVKSLVEIELENPEDFRKIRESLTRIGISVDKIDSETGEKIKKLIQSCHIIHKQGRYFIVHFKELYRLDGREADISREDFQRRNRIIALLLEWEFFKLLSPEKILDQCSMSKIRVISRKQMIDEGWTLEPRYTFYMDRKDHNGITNREKLKMTTKV